MKMGYVKYVRVYTRNIHLMMRNMMAMKVSFREKVDKELDAEALRVVGLMLYPIFPSSSRSSIKTSGNIFPKKSL